MSRSWPNEFKGILAVRSDYCHCHLGCIIDEFVAASVGRSAASDTPERRAEAQFICQTLVDECQVGSLAIDRVDRERVSDAPGWTYSMDLQPTQIANLIKVRVRVWREDESTTQSNDQPVFELCVGCEV